MSWQPFVDEHLMCDIEGHHLTSAAIIGHDGTVWAQSADFPSATIPRQPGRRFRLRFKSRCHPAPAVFPPLKPEDMTNLMKGFDEPGNLALTGLLIGSTKYRVIQGELGAVIRGKKGSRGVTLKKTVQGLVVGIYDEPMTPEQCNLVVERLGDYLVEWGL